MFHVTIDFCDLVGILVLGLPFVLAGFGIVADVIRGFRSKRGG